MSELVTVANKAARTLVAETANAAGSQTVGAGVDLSAAMGMAVTGRVANGATGPTVGCDFVVEVSQDGQTWRQWSRQRAGVEADRTYAFVVELPAAVMHARAVFEGNTDEAVTVEALGQELSGLTTEAS